MTGAEWADWDYRNRLVFARDGRICAATELSLDAIQSRELYDARAECPTSVKPPAWAVERVEPFQ